MLRIKRPFYIIGHNPNTIAEAEEFLSAGANALEPDIIYKDGQFYVSHFHPLSYDGVLTLGEYLSQLKQLIDTKNYPLALLIFDLKDDNFDINQFIQQVKQFFHGGSCDGVAILMTHADNHEFICRYSASFPGVGVGVDESDLAPKELDKIFKAAGQKNFTYADGITTILNKPGLFQHVCQARDCTYESDSSFKLVYTWVLELEGSMRRYLDACVDGIFVDVGG